MSKANIISSHTTTCSSKLGSHETRICHLFLHRPPLTLSCIECKAEEKCSSEIYQKNVIFNIEQRKKRLQQENFFILHIQLHIDNVWHIDWSQTFLLVKLQLDQRWYKKVCYTMHMVIFFMGWYYVHSDLVIWIFNKTRKNWHLPECLTRIKIFQMGNRV